MPSASTCSEYLLWVKTRAPGRFNLATSGILPCSLAEIGVGIEDLEITGPGLYGYEPLQLAIAGHCRVPVDCVVAASGTSMANFIAMAALVQSGDEVLIEHPVYEPLLALARYFGVAIKRFPRQSRPRDFFSNRTRLVVITNLHNPSCTQLEVAWLQELIEAASESGARVLADEVYMECLYEKRSSAFHLGAGVIATGSLTKAYGLGGLRCGWILAQPDLARQMWRIKDLIDPGAVHSAERLSVVALHGLESLRRRAKGIVDTNRKLLCEFLNACPEIELTMPDHGTCVFPRIRDGNADRLFEVLHNQYDTDIVPGRFFEMPDHFRLGIGGESSALAEGLHRLGRALSSTVLR